MFNYFSTKLLRINIAKILGFLFEEGAICEICIYGYTELDNSMVKLELYRNDSFECSKKVLVLSSKQIYNKHLYNCLAIPALQSVRDRKDDSAVSSYLKHSFESSKCSVENMNNLRLEIELKNKKILVRKVLNRVILKKAFRKASQRDFNFIILFKLHQFLFSSKDKLINHHLNLAERIQKLEERKKKFENTKDDDQNTSLEYSLEDIEEELESDDLVDVRKYSLKDYENHTVFPALKKFLNHVKNYAVVGINDDRINFNETEARILKQRSAFGVLLADFYYFFIKNLINKKSYDELLLLKNPKIHRKEEIYRILTELNEIYQI